MVSLRVIMLGLGGYTNLYLYATRGPGTSWTRGLADPGSRDHEPMYFVGYSAPPDL